MLSRQIKNRKVASVPMHGIWISGYKADPYIHFEYSLIGQRIEQIFENDAVDAHNLAEYILPTTEELNISFQSWIISTETMMICFEMFILHCENQLCKVSSRVIS